MLGIGLAHLALARQRSCRVRQLGHGPGQGPLRSRPVRASRRPGLFPSGGCDGTRPGRVQQVECGRELLASGARAQRLGWIPGGLAGRAVVQVLAAVVGDGALPRRGGRRRSLAAAAWLRGRSVSPRLAGPQVPKVRAALVVGHGRPVAPHFRRGGHGRAAKLTWSLSLRLSLLAKMGSSPPAR